MAYAKCIQEDELSYESMGYRPKGRDRNALWTSDEVVGRRADVARSTPATVEARPTPAAPTARMSTASSSTDRPLRPRVSVTPTSQRVETPKGKGKGRGKPEFSDKGKSKGKDKGKPEFAEKGKGKREFVEKGKGASTKIFCDELKEKSDSINDYIDEIKVVLKNAFVEELEQINTLYINSIESIKYYDKMMDEYSLTNNFKKTKYRKYNETDYILLKT
jgi:hypothetical protein